VSDDVVKIAPNETKEVTFLAGAPGSYFYWASDGRQTMNERMLSDAMLSGAIIVDPKSGVTKGERIFLISVWRTERDAEGYSSANPREVVVVNGKSWPYTERFTFNQGDTVSGGESTRRRSTSITCGSTDTFATAPDNGHHVDAAEITHEYSNDPDDVDALRPRPTRQLADALPPRYTSMERHENLVERRSMADMTTARIRTTV
jgi:hypothetical protein